MEIVEFCYVGCAGVKTEPNILPFTLQTAYLDISSDNYSLYRTLGFNSDSMIGFFKPGSSITAIPANRAFLHFKCKQTPALMITPLHIKLLASLAVLEALGIALTIAFGITAALGGGGESAGFIVGGLRRGGGAVVEPGEIAVFITCLIGGAAVFFNQKRVGQEL